MTPRVLGVGTASPEYAVGPAEARQFAERVFGDRIHGLERLLRIFDRSSVIQRQLVRPLEWFAEARPFPEKNAVYQASALSLSTAAARRALDEAHLAPSDVRCVVFVSSTGIATPSLDARLAQDLGLRPDVARVPLWGLGCGGGAAGLARAATLARGGLGPVLLVATEICSATFIPEDGSKSNLVAASLFGDGAAAAVVGDGERGPDLVGAHAHLYPDSEDVMGWDVVEPGLKVRFAVSIPRIVRASMADIVRDSARSVGLDPSDLRHYVLHPGGDKVIAAYVESLGLNDAQLRQARDVLGNHGNMSSPTVLFVLEQFLRETPASDEHGLIVGLGPGFAAETVAFRW